MISMLTENFSRFQALDKIRFLALTDKEVLGEGDDTNLEIQVSGCCLRCFEFMKHNKRYMLLNLVGLSKK